MKTARGIQVGLLAVPVLALVGLIWWGGDDEPVGVDPASASLIPDVAVVVESADLRRESARQAISSGGSDLALQCRVMAAGQPVEGCEIYLLPSSCEPDFDVGLYEAGESKGIPSHQPLARAVSDIDGRARIGLPDDWREALVDLVAMHPDYRRAGLPALHPASCQDELRIELQLGAAIRGVVLDGQALPVVGSKVFAVNSSRLLFRGAIHGESTAERLLRARPALADDFCMRVVTTGRDGTFEIGGLLPGSYAMELIDDHWIRIDDHREGFGPQMAATGDFIELRAVPAYHVALDVVDAKSGESISPFDVNFRLYQDGEYTGTIYRGCRSFVERFRNHHADDSKSPAPFVDAEFTIEAQGYEPLVVRSKLMHGEENRRRVELASRATIEREVVVMEQSGMPVDGCRMWAARQDSGERADLSFRPLGEGRYSVDLPSGPWTLSVRHPQVWLMGGAASHDVTNAPDQVSSIRVEIEVRNELRIRWSPRFAGLERVVLAIERDGDSGFDSARPAADAGLTRRINLEPGTWMIRAEAGELVEETSFEIGVAGVVEIVL